MLILKRSKYCILVKLQLFQVIANLSVNALSGNHAFPFRKVFLLYFEEKNRDSRLFCWDIEMQAYLLLHVQSMQPTLKNRDAWINIWTYRWIYHEDMQILRKQLFPADYARDNRFYLFKVNLSNFLS